MSDSSASLPGVSSSGPSLRGRPWTFLHAEILGWSVSAALVRSWPLPVYVAQASTETREEIRDALQAFLAALGPQYAQPVSEAQHAANLEFLARDVSRQHRAALAHGTLRIGTAQKALNLYLKYLWCVGRAAEPPHCPLDQRMLALSPETADVQWTQIIGIQEYERCIRALKDVAQARSCSLAQLELELNWGDVEAARRELAPQACNGSRHEAGHE